MLRRHAKRVLCLVCLTALVGACDGDGGEGDAAGGGDCADNRGAVACTAMDQAAGACDFVDAAAECATNLRCCSTEDVGRWKARLECLATRCAAGADEAAADSACSGHLDGVSWGCNPWGGGI